MSIPVVTAAQAVAVPLLGERNGQFRHGERTKAAIAEQQKFSALPEIAPRWRDMNLAAAYGSEAPC